MHFRYKVGSKLGLKRKLRLSSGHKETLFITYFVKTSSPRYVGTKQGIILTQYGGEVAWF